MVTHAQVQDWYETFFGHTRDANSQNAISALHALLGTDNEKLEDKLTGGTMKKTADENLIDALNQGIVNIKE